MEIVECKTANTEGKCWKVWEISLSNSTVRCVRPDARDLHSFLNLDGLGMLKERLF